MHHAVEYVCCLQLGVDHKRMEQGCEDVLHWEAPMAAPFARAGLFCLFDGHQGVRVRAYMATRHAWAVPKARGSSSVACWSHPCQTACLFNRFAVLWGWAHAHTCARARPRGLYPVQAAAAAKEQLPGILRGKLTAGSGAGAGAQQAALVGTRPQAEQVRMHA